MENNEESIPPEPVNSINISPKDVGEITWETNLMYLINKSENGQVEIPARFYEELVDRCMFNCLGFVYFN